MKIVLISQQGSGTTLLRSFLNSHPDVYIELELFGNRSGEHKYLSFKHSAEKDPIKYLEKFYLQEKGTIGFDLKYNQMTNEILDYIEDNKIFVIQLIRNPGRTFLRQINSHQIRDFTYEDVQEHCEYVENNILRIKERFQGIRYEQIYYEDMTRGQEIQSLPVDFEKRILQLLNVKYQRLQLTDTFKKLFIRY